MGHCFSLLPHTTKKRLVVSSPFPIDTQPEEKQAEAATNDHRTFTIYTSSSNLSQALTQEAQIVLTITPHKQDEPQVAQTPVAWKVLKFSPQSDIQHILTWYPDPAFSVLGTAGQSIHVPLGSSAVLKSTGGGVMWTSTTEGKRGNVIARNETNIPQSFCLGFVNKNDQFEPCVVFPPTAPGASVTVQPPAMLQAYSVNGCEEGKPLASQHSQSFIFRDRDGRPQPVDLTTLKNAATFMLSSQPSSGQLVLE